MQPPRAKQGWGKDLWKEVTKENYREWNGYSGCGVGGQSDLAEEEGNAPESSPLVPLASLPFPMFPSIPTLPDVVGSSLHSHPLPSSIGCPGPSLRDSGNVDAPHSAGAGHGVGGVSHCGQQQDQQGVALW